MNFILFQISVNFNLPEKSISKFMKINEIRILLVDDMESMRGIIKSTLQKLGVVNIHTAINGYDAIKTLSKKEVDLVISDWDMPKVTGIEFLKYMRSTTKYKKMPVILLTASNERSRVKEAIEAGASDYLTKPFKAADLEQKLTKLIDKINQFNNRVEYVELG